MVWATAHPPLAPPGRLAEPCALVAVDGGFLTGFDRGRTHAVPGAGARSWMTGAVHDAGGELVEASLRRWAGDPFVPVAIDPAQVAVPARGPRLEGRWLYAGHWAQHFGHFFLEVLSSLWPDPDTVGGLDGLLAHRSYRGGGEGQRSLWEVTPAAWQAELLTLAGWGGLPVRVARRAPVRVERMLVPERPVLLKSWARPEAAALWQRVSDAVGGRGPYERLFLSRSALHTAGAGVQQTRRADRAWDAHLDASFAAAGFAILHPQTVPITEQLSLVRGARVLAGASGSQLHLSAFAAPGTRVLEIGDGRSPTAPMPSQRAVDAACGHLAEFVPHLDADALARVLAGLEG